MPRIVISPGRVKLWVSARETYAWANRPGNRWPCSQLSFRRFYAEFDTNGLCDFTLDGQGLGSRDLDSNELTACCRDMIGKRDTQGANV